MEAPKKIYLQICGECKDNDCKNCKFEDLEENVTHCKDKIFDNDIEYIRTDVFIEKAKKWMNNNICRYDSESIYDREELVRDFENYMKGE